MFKIIPNRLYKYEIKEVKKIEQEIENTGYTLSNISINKIFFNYKMIKSDIGDYILIEFDSVIMENKSANKISTMGLNNNNLEISNEGNLNAFKGAVFKLKLDWEGKILEMNGYEEFRKKFDGDNLGSLRDDKKLASIDQAPFQEQYFRDIFERISYVLPDKNISNNSEWIQQNSEDLGGPLNLKTIFKVEEIDNEFLIAKTHAKAQKQINTFILNGTETGIIKVEIESELLVHSEKILEMSGMIAIGDKTLLMTINKETNIIGRKVS